MTKLRMARPTNAATPSEALASGADSIRDQLEKSMDTYSTYSTMAKDAMEAWMQSAAAARKGLYAINSENLIFIRQSVGEAVTTFKATMAAKSVEDYMALQTDYARSTLDSCVNQSSKVGEVMADTLHHVWEPFRGPFETAEGATGQKQAA